MTKQIEKPNQVSMFYFLVTGTLYLKTPVEPVVEDEPPFRMDAITLNVVITTPDPVFGHQALADANNGLQFRYRKDSGDVTGEVINILLNNVFPMGYMTKEQYEWRRPATEQQGG